MSKSGNILDIIEWVPKSIEKWEKVDLSRGANKEIEQVLSELFTQYSIYIHSPDCKEFWWNSDKSKFIFIGIELRHLRIYGFKKIRNIGKNKWKKILMWEVNTHINKDGTMIDNKNNDVVVNRAREEMEK